MKLTDTHCHLDIGKFNSDRQAVIQRAVEAGLTRILVPGLTVASSQAAVKLADSHPMLHAAVGVHPNDADTWDGQSITALRELSANSLKVVAIGEVGLDYYWNKSPCETQIAILKEQLALAEELSLPVVLHCREKGDVEQGECSSDLMKILEDWQAGLQSRNKALAERPGVLHSFSGSRETAERAIRLNFLIGVTGPITFPNASKRREIIASLPLDRLLIETDAPFLAPQQHRGKRNEPAFVCHIADKIGEIHSKHPEEIAAVTSANAARLFVWGD